MLLPLASLFTACGKGKGYNLNKLDNDFNKLATQNNNVAIKENGDLVFEYTELSVVSAINEVTPYNQLKKYNEVFYNLMAFSTEYIDECAKNSATDNVEIKNQVKSDLQQLNRAMREVNGSINVFAEMINVNKETNIKAEACVATFKNLLKSYDNLFEKSINFNNSLSDLYFNYILKDGNPDIYSKNLSDFNSADVILKLKSRICFQKSNLSQSFVEMYVDENLAEKVASEQEIFDLNRFNYSSNISNISKNFDESTAVEVANNVTNKERLYELAIRAQNLQSTIKYEQDKFVKACNSIDYSLTKENEAATEYQLLCVRIIDSTNMLFVTYNSVLSEMLNIMTSAS